MTDQPIGDWPLPTKGPNRLVILRVIDGDTVECGLIVPVFVRVRGVNCPELRDPGGPEAKAFTEALLIDGTVCNVDLAGRDKYGRYVADFFPDSHGWAEPLNLAKALIDHGHGKVYP